MASPAHVPMQDAAPPLDVADRIESSNGAPLSADVAPPVDAADDRDFRLDQPLSAGGKPNFREKQIKPNKVYIGGLPEHTRQEDLRNCFGKLGNIVNIELKLGYGFVEFDSRESAEESVAKYHEGFFMGNKIRVELSHGGGRTAKYNNGDPGACFKCGNIGHWARECPHATSSGPRRGGYMDAPSRDYPPRDPYREDYGRYSGRDPRYVYDYPPPREYRRPLTPPRDYRDYPSSRPPRDYDEYRARPAPPSRGYYGNDPYPPRSYDAPPSRDTDRRAPPADRFAPYPPARPRTPPGPPPRARDDFDRAPRDYPPEYRARPTTPPLPPAASSGSRYSEYPPRSSGGGYRRRSQSPPARSTSANYRSGSYAAEHGSDAAPFSSGSAAYSGSAGYSGNGYSSATMGAPPRSGGSARERDYPPRNGAEPTSYARRA